MCAIEGLYLFARAAVSNDDSKYDGRITLHVHDASVFAAVHGTGVTWVSREAPVFVLNGVSQRHCACSFSGFRGLECVL
jgi:hypothetical protein